MLEWKELFTLTAEGRCARDTPRSGPANVSAWDDCTPRVRPYLEERVPPRILSNWPIVIVRLCPARSFSSFVRRSESPISWRTYLIWTSWDKIRTLVLRYGPKRYARVASRDRSGGGCSDANCWHPPATTRRWPKRASPPRDQNAPTETRAIRERPKRETRRLEEGVGEVALASSASSDRFSADLEWGADGIPERESFEAGRWTGERCQGLLELLVVSLSRIRRAPRARVASAITGLRRWPVANRLGAPFHWTRTVVRGCLVSLYDKASRIYVALHFLRTSPTYRVLERVYLLSAQLIEIGRAIPASCYRSSVPLFFFSSTTDTSVSCSPTSPLKALRCPLSRPSSSRCAPARSVRRLFAHLEPSPDDSQHPVVLSTAAMPLGQMDGGVKRAPQYVLPGFAARAALTRVVVQVHRVSTSAAARIPGRVRNRT